MANLNDFKLVRKKSAKCFDNFIKTNPINIAEFDDIAKERLGFYFLILECVTNEKEINDLRDMIIDTEFSKKVLNIGNNDYGIDAVYIDEDNKIIKLFNFKYRENFTGSTKEGDIFSGTRFFSVIESENTNGLDILTKSKVDLIIDKLKQKEEYELILYLVANVNETFNMNNVGLESFKDTFGLRIEQIVLDDIIAFVSDNPANEKAKLIVDSQSLMTYETNSYSTNKSFLVKLSLVDVARITCNNEEYRLDPNLEVDELQKAKLNLKLLYENVRGYLGNTKYNKNIINTIMNTSEEFFMYNNGITLVANNISSREINGRKKQEIILDGFQIVNGGQTIRSIFDFINDSFDAEKLADASVLVRIFQTSDDVNLKNSIAEYTNSQNAISSSDLKSVNKIQIQIEAALKEKGIFYKRKSGDVGDDNNYSYIISKEKLAQIIYSAKGYPSRAINNKKKLFEDYYEDIFPENLDISNVEVLIDEYMEIVNKYKQTRYENFETKYLYIVYIIHKDNSKEIDDAIEILENALNNYKPAEQISVPRKMLQSKFIEHLNNSL